MEEIEGYGLPEDPFEDDDEEELLIVKKITDMMEYAYLALAQFPRSEAIVADVKRCMDRLLERAIEANKKYFKKNTLQDMDVELAKLKKYIRLTYRLKFLPFNKYKKLDGEDERDRTNAGWMDKEYEKIIF